MVYMCECHAQYVINGRACPSLQQQQCKDSVRPEDETGLPRTLISPGILGITPFNNYQPVLTLMDRHGKMC